MDKVHTLSYQCPNCNAALEYDNETGGFRCFYCDSTFTEAQIQELYEKRDDAVNLDESAEPELSAYEQEIEEFSGQSALYSCPNCGAGVICDTLTASTRCHFCHTPVILSGRLSGEYKPDFIIPFAITKDQARDKFYNYTKGKFLLPRGFRSEAQIENISALYVPYWLKSGLVDGDLTATGKTIRKWSVGDTRYTHTKVYHVEREAEFAFERVPCDGSKHIDDALMESIEPFMYNGLKKFNMSYLSGCAAEKYDVAKEDAAVRIDQRVQQAAGEELKRLASVYTVLENVVTNIRYHNQKYAYALLPVWFLNYKYNGKDYSFGINGQTGTTFGELPVSKGKLWLYRLGLFAAALAVAFVLLLLLGYFMSE